MLPSVPVVRSFWPSSIIAFLLSSATFMGCGHSVGGECSIQTDCRGDLICFCSDWGPYQCRAPQVCTTRSDASASCAKQDSCRTDGLCEAPRRAALADNAIPMCDATPEICGAHDGAYEGCRVWGRCSEARRICIANSQADCAASEGCAKTGMCSLQHEYCAPASDAECAASQACKTNRLCKLGAGLAGCVE